MLYRLFYQSGEFQEGLSITTKFWSPDLIVYWSPEFTELSDGLYYWDCPVPQKGKYVGIIYENGVARKSWFYDSVTGQNSGPSGGPGNNMSLLDDINAKIAELAVDPECDYTIGDKTVRASQKLSQLLEIRRQLTDNPTADIKWIEFDAIDIDEIGREC